MQPPVNQFPPSKHELLLNTLQQLLELPATSVGDTLYQSAQLVTADPSRIQQAMENLLSNATTHAEGNTAVQVMVKEEQHDEEPWASVTVSNQGPPIPSEQLTPLFQPFAKGKQSQGMGLGLHLAERIAHAHHGRLTVRTEAGPTTHFTLSWPSRSVARRE